MKSANNQKSPRRAWRLLFIVGVALFSLLVFALQSFNLERGAPVSPSPRPPPAAFSEMDIAFGRAYRGAGWQLYFNAPDASVGREAYTQGIDAALAAAIAAAQETLDIAAFELNSEAIYAAILAAYERGLAVRIVTDDEHGLEDDDSYLRDLRAAGIAVFGDERSALMHNKFMILDRRAVWTGSWNYTVNGSYRNNNNAFVM